MVTAIRAAKVLYINGAITGLDKDMGVSMGACVQREVGAGRERERDRHKAAVHD